LRGVDARVAGAAHIQRNQLPAQRVPAVVEQHLGPSAFQQGLLALWRMLRCQRQVHRATAQQRKQAPIERRGFLQAHADHCRCFEIGQQWPQLLLDRQCLTVQLPISQHLARDIQGRPPGEGPQAGLQPFDHRHLGGLAQRWVSGAIEPVHECQRVQALQALFRPTVGAGWLGKVPRVAGKTADVQGNPLRQPVRRLSMQALAVTTGLFGHFLGRQQPLFTVIAAQLQGGQAGFVQRANAHAQA